MQLIAAYMGAEITNAEFGLIGIAQYMYDAKTQLVLFAQNEGMDHPHYVESYYLLSAKLN